MDKKIKIENKPKYCHAWVSKTSSKVMCNSIPCCGYSIHGLTDKVLSDFKDTDKIGRHPLVDGKFKFDDGTFHDPDFVREHILIPTTKYTVGGKTYIFSNENLKKGDKVFPISDGFIGDDGKYYHQCFNFDSILSDFPDEPHVIINLKHSNYKPYEVRTDKGYGPIESYYKVMNIVKLNRE